MDCGGAAADMVVGEQAARLFMWRSAISVVICNLASHTRIGFLTS
jgi:hypothetical protein